MAIDLGNRVFTKVDRADRALVEAFKDIPSSNINDMMNRLFCICDLSQFSISQTVQ